MVLKVSTVAFAVQQTVFRRLLDGVFSFQKKKKKQIK